MLGSVQCKVTALFSANKIVNVTHLSLTDEGFSKSNYWIIHFRNKLAVNEFDFQWNAGMFLFLPFYTCFGFLWMRAKDRPYACFACHHQKPDLMLLLPFPALQCRLECESGYIAQRTPLITCVNGEYAKGCHYLRPPKKLSNLAKFTKG